MKVACHEFSPKICIQLTEIPLFFLTGSTGPAGHYPRAALHHDADQAERGGGRDGARLEVRRHGRRPRLSHHFHALHHHRHFDCAAQCSSHHSPVKTPKTRARQCHGEREQKQFCWCCPLSVAVDNVIHDLKKSSKNKTNDSFKGKNFKEKTYCRLSMKYLVTAQLGR